MAARRASLGLYDPLWLQYVHYLQGVLTGDLGTSLTSRLPVSEVISQRLPATAQLAVLAFLVVVALAVPIGVAMGVLTRGGRARRRELAFSSASVVAGAVPDFLLGVGLVYVFGVQLGWLPVAGQRGASSYVLPVLALACFLGAVLTSADRWRGAIAAGWALASAAGGVGVELPLAVEKAAGIGMNGHRLDIGLADPCARRDPARPARRVAHARRGGRPPRCPPPRRAARSAGRSSRIRRSRCRRRSGCIGAGGRAPRRPSPRRAIAHRRGPAATSRPRRPAVSAALAVGLGRWMNVRRARETVRHPRLRPFRRAELGAVRCYGA